MQDENISDPLGTKPHLLLVMFLELLVHEAVTKEIRDSGQDFPPQDRQGPV
jgi:hypothetical protein